MEPDKDPSPTTIAAEKAFEGLSMQLDEFDESDC